jgi:putative copper resistance protein D
METALTLVRAAHFGAVIMLFGQFAYAYLVAPDEQLPPRFRATLATSLAVAIVSAVAWLFLEASSMSGLPPGEAWRDGAVGTVLRETHFGNVCVARLAVAIVVAVAGFAMDPVRRRGVRLVCAIGAMAILASLAACGHAAAGSGTQGAIRLTADALHLIAAGAWLGALVPFAALLKRSASDDRGLDFAHRAAARFSTLGIVSVGAIVLTGIINTRYTVQTLDALGGSRYGTELIVKLTIFVAIVGFAAANRWSLTPRMARHDAGGARALGEMRRNALVELALGLAIVAIVGNLGITMPPEHDDATTPAPRHHG